MNAIQQQILKHLETLPDNLQLEVLNFVQHLKMQHSQPCKNNGVKIASVMKQMADRQTFPDIKDPSTWQREIRKDRPLPTREQ